MTRISIREVRRGWDKGFHAEVKKLWDEAGKTELWEKGPGVNPGEQRKQIRKETAKAISTARLKKWLQTRAIDDYEADYWQLYDGTNWRATEGTKEEIGLMITARLGGLLLTDSKAAAGWKGNPTCTMCGKEGETAQHMLLRCDATREARGEMLTAVEHTLTAGQMMIFQAAEEHNKKLYCLENRWTNT